MQLTDLNKEKSSKSHQGGAPMGRGSRHGWTFI